MNDDLTADITERWTINELILVCNLVARTNARITITLPIVPTRYKRQFAQILKNRRTPFMAILMVQSIQNSMFRFDEVIQIGNHLNSRTIAEESQI